MGGGDAMRYHSMAIDLDVFTFSLLFGRFYMG